MKQIWFYKGFTLIELLAVVVIIAILAGLSFPAIVKTRTRGQIVKSANNLKNIGIACRLYTGDYGGVFPLSSTPQSTPARADYNLLIPNYATKGIFQAPTDDVAVRAAAANTGNAQMTTPNENSYTYFAGLDVIAITGNLDTNVTYETSIPIATEKLSQVPVISVDAQTVSPLIFRGAGVNILKSDGAVIYTNATANAVRLYRDTLMASSITNTIPQAGWRNNE